MIWLRDLIRAAKIEAGLLAVVVASFVAFSGPDNPLPYWILTVLQFPSSLLLDYTYELAANSPGPWFVGELVMILPIAFGQLILLFVACTLVRRINA